MVKSRKKMGGRASAADTNKAGRRSRSESDAGVAVPRVLTPEVLDRVHSSSSESDEEAEESQRGLAERERGEGEEPSELEDESGSLPAEIDASAVTLPVVAEATPGVERSYQHDLLKQYLAEVSKYPLLSPEEEFDLAIQLRESGDIEAARRLVRANLRLVVKIAMEYRSAYQNVLDLIQEGNIGLMKAVSKFDPSKGAKLSYYAGWWIRSYILKYILDNFRLVKVGTTQAQKKLFFHLMREKERLEAQGLYAGPKLLADKLQVREQDVVEMEQRLSGRGAELSLHRPLDSGGEDEGRATHLDMLADPAAAPDEALAGGELRSILKSRLEQFAKTLKEKELAVFRERLASEEPKTLQEVADQFGLTRERARQIEAQVVEKLREFYQRYIR